MKKFISNNWQKILIFIGAVFIILNVFSKLSAEKSLLDDYVEYGPTIQKENTQLMGKGESIINNVTETVTNNSLSSEFPFPPELIKLIIILIAAILFVVVLSSIGDRVAAKAKAKKK